MEAAIFSKVSHGFIPNLLLRWAWRVYFGLHVTARDTTVNNSNVLTFSVVSFSPAVAIFRLDLFSLRFLD